VAALYAGGVSPDEFVRQEIVPLQSYVKRHKKFSHDSNTGTTIADIDAVNQSTRNNSNSS
jgi:hypothetical protein